MAAHWMDPQDTSAQPRLTKRIITTSITILSTGETANLTALRMTVIVSLAVVQYHSLETSEI